MATHSGIGTSLRLSLGGSGRLLAYEAVEQPHASGRVGAAGAGHCCHAALAWAFNNVLKDPPFRRALGVNA